MKTKSISWLIFTIFVLLAAYNSDESLFYSNGPFPVGKYISWITFLGFAIYSYYCSRHENLFRTLKTMLGLHWGRQIGIDLYIGLLLFMVVIYIHQQSVLVAALWLLAVMAFANLATLLYIALHYDSLMQLLLPG